MKELNPMPEEQTQTLSASDIQRLVRDLESLPNGETRVLVAEVLREVLHLHCVALEHVLQKLTAAELGRQMVEELLDDPVVRNLLLLHGLHPTSVETRVRSALQELEAYWKSAGLELVGLETTDGTLHLRFQRNGPVAGPTLALRSLIENAIISAAPDLDEIKVEGLGDQPLTHREFVPLKEFLRVCGSGLLA